MPVHDEIGKRMKEFYESVPKTKLVRRMPVIIRLDGKAFHTFTRGFKRPFDDVLIETMQETMLYLCETIQGCVLGYTQSDEITLVLVDYKKLNSDAWLGYEVQKMCSIAASMCTMAFNRIFETVVNRLGSSAPKEVRERYLSKTGSAMFDARVFNIPKEEVCNCLYWRQLDATRNSIQMLGQAHFSFRELQNKTSSAIQDMLMTQKGINWNDLEDFKKRGSCCIKRMSLVGADGKTSERPDAEGKERMKWEIDRKIPIFSQNRAYVDDLVNIDDSVNTDDSLRGEM